MDSKTWMDISIRGRIAYVILCFERYVTTRYAKRDWRRVSEMMWQICDKSDYIDKSASRYMEIIPEYLFEFQNYAEAEFDDLSKEDFNFFVRLIPRDDPDLNAIMLAIYHIAMEYAYVAMEKNAPDTLVYIENVLTVMRKARIPAPDIQPILKYTFDESGGWGRAFDGRALSIIV